MGDSTGANAGGLHPFVSVVVPTLGADLLGHCLSALEAQSYPRDRYEVIVVDNGCAGLHELFGDSYSAVVFLEEGVRSSYAARNRGIESARGEVVAFTDADCIPEPSWIAEGVADLSCAPRCGLVAGEIRLFFRQADHPNACELFERIFTFQQQRYAEEEHFGSTSNVFTWRRVIDDIGGFDGSVKSGGDREWGNRVFNSGYEVNYSATAIVSHPTRASLRALLARSARIAGGEHDLWSKRSRRWARAFVVLPRYLLPTSRLATVFQDSRLSTGAEKFRVCAIVMVVSYVKLFERLRVLAGGEKRRR